MVSPAARTGRRPGPVSVFNTFLVLIIYDKREVRLEFSNRLIGKTKQSLDCGGLGSTHRGIDVTCDLPISNIPSVIPNFWLLHST